MQQLKDHEKLDCYINQIPPSRHGDFREKIQSLLNNTVSTDLGHRNWNCCLISYEFSL